MKNDIYHMVTINDGKSDTAAIMKVFSEMETGRLKCDLTLLNYYDEVPIAYASTITAVEKDSIELSVHEHQAVIMKHHKSTLMRSKHFQSGLGVHCYVAYVNVPKKAAILHNFAYAQIRAERREAVRVKVRGAQPLTFCYENVTIEGCMVDISGNGVAIISDRVPATNPEQSGVLYFNLNGTALAVSGSFVRSTTNEIGLKTCMFQIKPDRKIESIIGQFIYQRQVEIILELKEGLIVQ